MHKETWLTRRSNTGSPQFTDLQSHCLCSESSLTNLIARVIVWQYETFSCPKAALSTKNHDLWEQPFWNTKELTEFCSPGFTAQSASIAHAWNGCSQSLSFSDRWSRGTKTLGTRLVGLSPQFNTLCFFSHLVPRASKQPHGTHFDVAMATCLFPVSWLFKFKYYQLRLNKAKYLVSSKTCAGPTFHWASP